MERLAALEDTFVRLESQDVPFVFASILELDRPIELAALQTIVDAALAGLPRYRQYVERSRWVDETAFAITDHVHSAELGARTVEELAAALIAEPLPARRSPWQLHAVRTPDGHGAVIALVHHALVDGMSGMRLLEQILGRTSAASSTEPRREPRGGLRRLLSRRTVAALLRLLRDGLRPAAQLRINPRHTHRERAIASLTVSLADIQAIQRAYEVSNNDVVLATVAGALRRYAIRHGVDPAHARGARAMVPVARYAKSDRTIAGNQVVLQLAPLFVDEPDAVARLCRIAGTMHTLKAGRNAAAGDLLVALSNATTPALLANVLGLALRMRAFNVIVTNVRGPSTRLGIDGVQVERLVPVVNLWPHQAIGVAVASYAGALTFGIQVDRVVVPDIDAFRDDLAAAFAELRDHRSEERLRSSAGTSRR